ncbi:MAG TPA: hypothetical protein VJV79_17510 [Polyangiaceae bacterium]|nr:hypothetical protein [Polyangiaceae bacterium]
MQVGQLALLLLIDCVAQAHDTGVIHAEIGLGAAKRALKRLRKGFVIATLAALAACGGRAIEDSGSGGPEPSVPVGGGAGGGSTGKSNPNDPFPSEKLGTCKPGFERDQYPTRPCRWITEAGVCFDDTASACACICPRDRKSLCVHGFDDGPNSAELIYCL